jgi:hypothetical protein
VTRPLTALFVDCDSYFASVEQHLDPELRGRPVGVAPVLAESSCCIAASYEAITANSAVEPCGLPEWGHVGADDQVGEMPQCPRNDMAKIPCGFPTEAIHPVEKVVSGQSGKVPNPVLIGAFDNGVPPPTGTAVGPPAVAYERRVSSEWDDLPMPQEVQIVVPLADFPNRGVDTVEIRPVEIVVATAEIYRSRPAGRAKFCEVACDFPTVGGVPGHDCGVKDLPGELFQEALLRCGSGLVKMEVGQPRDAGRLIVRNGVHVGCWFDGRHIPPSALPTPSAPPLCRRESGKYFRYLQSYGIRSGHLHNRPISTLF